MPKHWGWMFYLGFCEIEIITDYLITRGMRFLVKAWEWQDRNFRLKAGLNVQYVIWEIISTVHVW